MTGQGRGWIIRVGVNRRITEGDIFFLAYRTNFFRSNYALENETTRPVSPRIRSAIHRPIVCTWRTAYTNPIPLQMELRSMHSLFTSYEGRGFAVYPITRDKRERCGEPLENNRVSALWKKKKRENNGGREREARISGTEIFRGIEKIFRSNERITSWNKLEQQVEKVEEGRSLCMGRELDRKNCSSPVSLFMHRRTRTHTHARTLIHAYIPFPLTNLYLYLSV